MTEARNERAGNEHAEGGGIGWSFLRSRRWIGYFAMLVVFAITCVLLGNWQFARRAEARAEIARLDANYEAAATPLGEELTRLDAFAEDQQKWQPVEVAGEYIGDPFLARNRPGPKGVGSDLIQALRTDTGEVFFVDRGWVPVDGASAGKIALSELPTAPAGTVRVTARLRASEPAIPGRSSEGRTVGSIDLPELARLTKTSDAAYVGAYGMLISESPAGETGELPAKPERDEGPHLSYALQWYVFILIAGIGVIYAARREYRGLNQGSVEVHAYETRERERKRRRGPSDSEEEDALLDA